jgi:hypothetical protein
MATRMQQRRGTAAQWTAANPVLAAGEIGFETDNNRFKIGNGATAWTALDYFANSAALSELLDGAPDALNTLNELAAAIGDDANFITTINNTVDNHTSSSTNIHGISDTSALITTTSLETSITDLSTTLSGNLSTHASETVNVHGIADTEDLITQTQLSDAIIAEATVTAGNLSTHTSETTNVHGIANTEDLVVQSELTDHINATTEVHGISDTSLLATIEYVDTTIGTATGDYPSLAGVGLEWNEDTEAFDIDSTVATKTYADDAVTAHNDLTQNVHGIADTSLLATTADVAAVTKTTLGLENVDNTSDADKPVSTATVTAIATAKSEAIAEVTAVIDGAPGALDTLNELAAALGDDANFAGTVTASLATKVDSFTPITQKTESYTLSTLDHRDDLIEMGSGSALTLTIPLNSSIAYPVGTSLDILQTGAGQVTIAGAAGVTVNATPGLKLRTQWSSATLFKRAENTWVVYGDLTA